ncbi:hypothetical protein BJX66DRAFT_44498 [Aspergillus keveii]|uniref:Uncharacterized protein n=1 Tax=Aspergillus keveii TaxID=714993 RepID=A0ABR4GGZ5_9EURO
MDSWFPRSIWPPGRSILRWLCVSKCPAPALLEPCKLPWHQAKSDLSRPAKTTGDARTSPLTKKASAIHSQPQVLQADTEQLQCVIKTSSRYLGAYSAACRLSSLRGFERHRAPTVQSITRLTLSQLGRPSPNPSELMIDQAPGSSNGWGK